MPLGSTCIETCWLMTPPVLKPIASTTSRLHAEPFHRPYMSEGCVAVVKAMPTFAVEPS